MSGVLFKYMFLEYYFFAILVACIYYLVKKIQFKLILYRTKLKQTEVDCEYLKRCCETLTEENRRLQKELQELRALKSSQPFYMQLPATTLTMCPSCERVVTTASANTATTNPTTNNHSRLQSHNPFAQAQAHMQPQVQANKGAAWDLLEDLSCTPLINPFCIYFWVLELAFIFICLFWGVFFCHNICLWVLKSFRNQRD